ncbi:MAG: DUF7901 domain-containing protein [Planctomycetota bacterium]|jgi:subtilisin-like proprotein convertase family protein
MRNLRLKLLFVCVFVLLAGTAYAEAPPGSALRPAGGGSGQKGGVGILANGPNCPADSLFSQRVAVDPCTSAAITSDANSTYLVYENFWDIGGTICDIHFWGLNLTCCWFECDEDPMTFEIKFYQDNAGVPGTEVCSYTVTLARTATGEHTQGYEVWEYSADLEPCCNLAAGWVSIQGISAPNDCWFLWVASDTGDGLSYQWVEPDLLERVDDLSLCLTGQPPKPPVPNLKWSQPPIPIDPIDDFPTYCGWDELSYMFFGPDGGPDNVQSVSPEPGQNSQVPVNSTQAAVLSMIAPAALASVAIFQDTNPWGSTWNQDILTANGISYTIYGTTDMGVVDISPYDKVIVSSSQASAFYTALETNRAWFEAYASAGGILDLHLASQMGAPVDGKVVPGGFVVGGQPGWDDVTIIDAAHPVLNTPHTITDASLDGWNYSIHGYFVTVPGGAHEIIRDANSGNPCAMDLNFGAGRIFATVQTVEYGGSSYNYLENTILYDVTAAIPGVLVADDFRCLGTMPVDSIHWWGSYYGWEEPGILPPELPIGWRIGFWSNLPPGGAQRAAYWDDPCLAIPDYNASTSTPGVVSHIITVPDSFTVDDVDIDVIIDHTYLRDLIIEVEHLGETVALWNRACLGDDDMDVIFDDEGNPVVCNSPTVGDVIPFQALSGFDGMDSAGDWKITVSDNEGADTGTLLHWSVHFNYGFSQPEELLHEFVVDDWRVDMEQVGIDYYYEFHPLDICYQYYLDLEPHEVFWQDEYLDRTEDEIFWLSITAIYPGEPCEPQFPWGWKTRPWSWMDDAVRFQLYEEPVPGIVLDPSLVEPIKDPLYEESFDVAFELDTDPNYIKWEQPFDGIRNWPHYEDEQSMATRKTWIESKWSQDPDMTPDGMDVDATQEEEPGPIYWWQPQVLADDFRCDETGPITDMHIWGSWYQDMPPYGDPGSVIFMISIYDDIPAGVVAPHSMPGQPLWERWFYPSEFDFGIAFEGEEGYYVPCEPYYEPFADYTCWKYDFFIDPGEAFIQQEGNIYWLSVQALVLDMGAAEPWTRFGWKSSVEQWNDNAVWAIGDFGYPLDPWEPLFHPVHGMPLDLAFELTTTKSEVSIDRLVADDWPCEANTPITAAAWWGSYIGYGYEACQDPQTASWMDLPVKPDYFLLNIWTDVPAVSTGQRAARTRFVKVPFV